ncbi:hypothetical protein BaRGS_00033560 [Batillaria attramentaria]|uniref:Uncharacterized protein n=1 Tax=Batillaria attramentaria TaxID=370345 RepID=A0ABD0JJN2_9CAEN
MTSSQQNGSQEQVSGLQARRVSEGTQSKGDKLLTVAESTAEGMEMLGNVHITPISSAASLGWPATHGYSHDDIKSLHTHIIFPGGSRVSLHPHNHPPDTLPEIEHVNVGLLTW